MDNVMLISTGPSAIKHSQDDQKVSLSVVCAHRIIFQALDVLRRFYTEAALALTWPLLARSASCH